MVLAIKCELIAGITKMVLKLLERHRPVEPSQATVVFVCDSQGCSRPTVVWRGQVVCVCWWGGVSSKKMKV